MGDNDLLSLSKLNILIKCNDNKSSNILELFKNEIETNKYLDFIISQKLIHYYILDNDTDRPIAEYESDTSGTSNLPVEYSKYSFDTPINLNFNYNLMDNMCQIEYYRNNLSAILLFDFTNNEFEFNLNLIFDEIDQFIKDHSNKFIYQTIVLIDTSKLTSYKRSSVVIRHLLGRNNIVFVPDIKIATYIIYDSIRYLCELIRLELKKLKANATPDIKTPYDLKLNFSNVPLKLIVGNKWIHSTGRNKKRIGDLNLLLGKNISSLEYYQQSLSASKHSGDKLFRAASQFGIAICLQKCYIQLSNIKFLDSTMTTNLRKINTIITYLERFGARGKGGVKIYHPRVYSNSDDDISEESDDSLEDSPKNVNFNVTEYLKLIKNAIRLCLFGCFNALLRLRAFPYKIFFDIARASCTFFTNSDMVNEFFDVISLMSYSHYIGCEGRDEWLAHLLHLLSNNHKFERKLAFYTLEIVSDESIDSEFALRACKLVANKLDLKSTNHNWDEIIHRLLEVSYEAATSIGDWNEANRISWSILSFSSNLSRSEMIAHKTLHGLVTTSILSLSTPVDAKEISNIIRVKSIVPNFNLNISNRSQPCSARIGVEPKSSSGGNYKIIYHNRINILTHRVSRCISTKLIQNTQSMDSPINNSFYFISNKHRNKDLNHQYILSDRRQWECGRDELVTVTIINHVNIPIVAKSIQLLTRHVECIIPLVTIDLQPGINTVIQSITPQDIGRLSIYGVRITLANKTFDFNLKENILINVKPTSYIESSIELLSIKDYENFYKFNKSTPLPMLYNRPRSIIQCKCNESSPCCNICSIIISRLDNDLYYDGREVLYDGEFRLVLLSIQNISENTINDIKISCGINDWLSSRLTLNPLVMLPLSRITSPHTQSGRSLFSTLKSIESPRINLNSLVQTSRSSIQSSRSVESNRSNTCLRSIVGNDIESGYKLYIPFILHSSIWSKDISIRISWSLYNSHNGNTSRRSTGTSYNYVEANITNPVKHPLSISDGGFKIYPLVSLNLKRVLANHKLKCIKSDMSFEFDNLSILVHVTFINLLKNDITIINNGSEIMCKSGEKTSIVIKTDRVPRDQHILKYIDDNIKLLWRLDGRCGGLYLSRLVKLNVFTKMKSKYNYKSRASKYAPRMSIWRRGVYTSLSTDTRTLLNDINLNLIYKPLIYFKVKNEYNVNINSIFTIHVNIVNNHNNINGWVFTIPYDVLYDEDNAGYQRVEESIYASGLMERPIDCLKMEYNFKYIAIRKGVYKIALGLVENNLNKIIWHYEPIIIKVE